MRIHLNLGRLLVLGATLFGGAGTLPGRAAEKPACCQELKPETPLPGKSIYQSDTTWTSDFDKKVPLRILQGRPQVVAMFFTKCDYACPVIVNDMKRIEAALPAEIREKVGFSLVSMDTERDTVEVLHAYRDKMALPADRWVLLRGSSEDVRELAALLGVRYKRDERGNYGHSNLITILSADGEIIRQQNGLNQRIEEMVKKLEESVKK